ncbi:MAG TPA: TRAP transporter large permease, partial [Opitutaceae bacterium]|nr:TRAP transporter large permease [Opitutaceae bacterium]
PAHVRAAAKAAAAAAAAAGGKGPSVIRAFFSALPSLLLVIVVLGGILGGLFSATEASAIAVAYCLLLGMIFYREVKLAALPDILLRAAKTTSVVMILVGASQAMSWVLAYEQIPQMVSEAMLALSHNPLMVLLLINVLLLIVGTFMDMTPAVLIFTPIFLPVVIGLGMDPVHFGIVIIANLCIGLCTPPVGTCLFLGCSVGKTTIARVVPSAVPFFLAMVVALLLITYVPALSLWLPSLFGL